MQSDKQFCTFLNLREPFFTSLSPSFHSYSCTVLLDSALLTISVFNSMKIHQLKVKPNATNKPLISLTLYQTSCISKVSNRVSWVKVKMLHNHKWKHVAFLDEIKVGYIRNNWWLLTI